MIFLKMLLDLFGAEGGEGAAGPSDGAPLGSETGVTAPDAGVQNGGETAAQTEVQPEPAADPDAEFEALIRDKYKDQFGKAVKGILDKRLPKAQKNKDQLDAVKPLINALAAKHGIVRGDNGRYDWNAVIKAELDSREWLREAAFRDGVSEEMKEHLLQIEDENAEYKAQEIERQQAQEEQRQAQLREEAYNAWNKDTEAIRQFYPNYDLDRELQNPAFIGQLAMGDSPQTAYEKAHYKELFQSGVAYAAQTAQRQLANSIATQGRRPVENGTKTASQGAVLKVDPRTFTPEQFAEYNRRAAMGEKITFT